MKICTNSRIIVRKLVREFNGRGWMVYGLNKL